MQQVDVVALPISRKGRGLFSPVQVRLRFPIALNCAYSCRR